MLCLALIAFASICSAQERTAQIVEVLDNDQFIVEIGGKEYRALNGDKVIELAKQKAEVEVCRVNETKYNQLLDIAERDVKIAQQQAAIHETNWRHAMQLYTTERELRVDGQQFIPHRQMGGFGGKIFSFLDGPYGQSLFKLVIPTATFIKTVKQ